MVDCGNQKRILAVLAHPDDETFGMGGTLAWYAAQGALVYLVCATRGEVGDVDPKYMAGFSTIGERREAELRCAAQTLGLTEVFFMGYRDSGMPGSPDNKHPRALVAQPLEQISGEVAGYIRQIKPQVVLTFDPIGGYRHPDHIAIHQATVQGFELAADSSFCDPQDLEPYAAQRLYFHTISRGFLKMAVFFLRLFRRDPHRFGRNGDIDLASLAEVEFPTHVRLDTHTMAKRQEQASACHASQGGRQMSGGFQGLVRKVFSRGDTFMQAYPPPSGDAAELTDLFAGVDIDL